MTRIFIFIALIGMTCSVSAQTYSPVTVLTGTQVVGGNTVSVTREAGNSITFCAASPYWIGSSIKSSYSFAFSTPVLSVRIRLTAMNIGEFISFSVNGAPYSLTAANRADFGGDCDQDQAVIVGGELTAPDNLQTPGAGTEINITDSSGISSITVAENKAFGNGTVFSTFISTNNTTASYNRPLCERDTLKLFAISTLRNASYSWTGPGGFTSSLQNPIIPNAGPANTGNYVVTATQGVFTDTNTVTVTFLPSPEPPVASYLETLCGTSLSLTATTTPAGAVYEWTGPDTFRSSSQSPVIPNAVERHNGAYTVVATIGSCHSLPAVVDVSLLKGALILHNADTLVCGGAVIALSATATPGYTYQWSPAKGLSDSTIANPMLRVGEAITYTLTASYPGCPDTSVNFTVDMQENPEVELGPDIEVCEGANLALEANITPYRKDYTYQWEPEGSGFSTPNAPNTALLADSTRQYMLAVSSPIGCWGRDTIKVLVHPGNFGTIAADTGYCLPDTVKLWAAGGTSYAWTPSSGLNNTAIAAPQARPATTTQYTVLITNEYACIDSLSVWVHVYPSAILKMLDSLKIYPGEQYQLETETNCSYFEWFPPSGLSDVGNSHPFVYPEVRTRYFVTGTTAQGCRVKDSVDVLVDCGIMELPNAFCPGIGGPNTLFRPSERGYADIHLKQFVVFNRWGNKLFETREPGKGWDGTYKGLSQPLGVYLYRIEGTNKCGEFSKTGQVTLLR